MVQRQRWRALLSAVGSPLLARAAVSQHRQREQADRSRRSCRSCGHGAKYSLRLEEPDRQPRDLNHSGRPLGAARGRGDSGQRAALAFATASALTPVHRRHSVRVLPRCSTTY